LFLCLIKHHPGKLYTQLMKHHITNKQTKLYASCCVGETNKLTLGLALSVYFSFPLSLLFHWCSMHIHSLVMNAIYCQQLVASLNNIIKTTQCFDGDYWLMQVSSGAIDMAKANLEKMLISCAAPVERDGTNDDVVNAQQKCLFEVTHELVRQVTSPNTLVREQVNVHSL